MSVGGVPSVELLVAEPEAVPAGLVAEPDVLPEEELPEPVDDDVVDPEVEAPPDEEVDEENELVLELLDEHEPVQEREDDELLPIDPEPDVDEEMEDEAGALAVEGFFHFFFHFFHLERSRPRRFCSHVRKAESTVQ